MDETGMVADRVEQRIGGQIDQPRVADLSCPGQAGDGFVGPAPLRQHLGMLIGRRLAHFTDQLGIGTFRRDAVA